MIITYLFSQPSFHIQNYAQFSLFWQDLNSPIYIKKVYMNYTWRLWVVDASSHAKKPILKCPSFEFQSAMGYTFLFTDKSSLYFDLLEYLQCIEST